ncbi:MAG: 2-dehydropantoate 2-reductase N-terminal domain-containing protein [Acidimicrobiales bacterium]
MRFIVFGAGAVGGVVGARLHQSGHDVTLIARGEHAAAIARDGLVLIAPGEHTSLPIPVVTGPAELDWTVPATVLLSVKGQDTIGALEPLAAAAPPSTPVVCMQNGVENERLVLRRFANTYGVCVMCATTHLRPGVVEAHYGPVTGLLDIGRYPRGEDDVSLAVSAALRAAHFGSLSRADIMYWKYRKLLLNLSNAVEALCGPGAARSELSALARREGEACLRAAGIAFASSEEDAERRRELFPTLASVGSPERVVRSGGGSTWQSLARGASSVEADCLNGEIVLLGRLHGVPTPVNELLRRLVVEAARSGSPPGGHDVDELLAVLNG